MRTGRIMMRVTAVLAMAGPVAYGQAAASSVSSPRFLLTSSAPATATTLPDSEIVREIDDPNNGDRWLLTHDSNHPAGPGVLVLASAARVPPRQAGPAVEAVPPVIRAGDRVIVEENTAVVEARLEAVAMSPAMAGSALNVRLTIGGRVLRVVAIGPGRAVFQEEAKQ